MSLYYTYTPLTPNTVARAADVNSRFNGISAGFDLLPAPSLLAEDRVTYSADSGVANAYVAAPSIPILAYNAGLRVRLKANLANTTASTVNVSGLGVKQIVRSDGSALLAGDIVAGQILDLTYDGTNFRLAMAFAEMSPAGISSKISQAGNILVNGSLTATSGFVNNGVTLNGLTSFGASLATTASAATARTLLGLGSAALSNVGDFVTAASPTFTGVPLAPTAAPGTNTTQIATTAYVVAAVAGGGGSYAPIASPTFTGVPAAPTAAGGTNTTQLATTAFVTSAVATRAPLASPTFTGVPLSTTAAVDTNTTQIATTAYVVAQGYLKSATAASTYVAANNAALTGVPTAPTPATGVNTTQIATTAYVQANLGNYVTTGTLASYAGLASPVFTGDPRAPTPATADNDTTIATTAYVKANLVPYITAATVAANYAPGDSPNFSGNPTAPTAAFGDADTTIATTAFVDRIRDLGPFRFEAATTLSLADRGALVASNSFTIPSNASVAFPVGSVVTLFNGNTTAVSLGINSDTLRLAGTLSTGTRSIAPFGLATIVKTAATEWVVSGNVS